MNNPDNKFIPVLDHVQDPDDKDEDYNIVNREMMPMEGESVFGSMIRSRHVISERIIRYMTNKDGYITPESVNMVIGQRAQDIIPITIPHGIISILDGIMSYTRKCAIEDGVAVYHKDHDYGMHEREYDSIKLSDMHVATHAIVVGNALLLSDNVISVSSKSVFQGTIIEASQRVENIQFDAIIRGVSRLSRTMFSDLDIRRVSSHVMDHTHIGHKVFRELHGYHDHGEDDFERFSVFSDIGTLELYNVMGIDPVISIIRYYLEMCKQEEHFSVIYSYFHNEMEDLIERFNYGVRLNVDQAERFASECE